MTANFKGLVLNWKMALAALDEAEAELASIKDQEPMLKKQYESWAAYEEVAECLDEWDQRWQTADAACTERRRIYDAITDELKKMLPDQVWIRVDDEGIGKAYSNWGGSHWVIECKPWQDEMPSLNHTYRGD